MEKAIEQIFKAFTHLARELQIYFLSGAFVIIELSLIDHLFLHKFAILFNVHFLLTNWLWLFLIMYIIGHTIQAFMYVVFEISPIESAIKRILSKGQKCDDLVQKEIHLFVKNPQLHAQFVERYNILNLMRWNLSGASLIISIIASLCLFSHFDKHLLLLSLANLVAFVFLLLLSLKTEIEMNDRIDKANNCIN